MRKNLYTKAVDSINAPKKTVDKMLEYAKNTNNKKFVNVKKYRLTGAVAACLAVLVAFGTVFLTSNTKTEKENSFFLTVNAAEATADEVKLNNNKFTQVAKLTHNGGTTRLIQRDSYSIGVLKDKTSSKLDAEGDFSSILSADCFDFNPNCEGDNIKQITYQIQNGSFRIKNTKNLTHLKKMYLLGEYDKKDTDDNLYDDEYSTFTVNAKNQNKLDKIELVAGAELLADNTPEAVIRAAGFDESIYHTETYSNSDAVKKDLDEYLDYILKDLSVKVKVSYNDNTTETKTLKFTADGKINNFERFKDEDNTYGYYWDTDIDVKAKLK